MKPFFEQVEVVLAEASGAAQVRNRAVLALNLRDLVASEVDRYLAHGDWPQFEATVSRLLESFSEKDK